MLSGTGKWSKDRKHVYKDRKRGYGMEMSGPGCMGQVLQSGGLGSFLEEVTVEWIPRR